MKKRFALILIVVLCLTLAGCGSSVPAEKIGKVDSLIAKTEVLVEDTAKEVEKTNNTGYDDVQKYYNENIAAVKQLQDIFAEIKKGWADNKTSMSEEQVDKLIAQLEDLEKQGQEMKQNSIDEVAAIGQAIQESEQVVAEALKGALADVDIYEVPKIAATNWEFMGSMTDGEELDEAGRQQVLKELGGKIELNFPDQNKAAFVTGQSTVNGSYTVDSANNIVVVTLENGTVFNCVFALSTDNVPLLIALTDNTANNAFYFTQINAK